MKAVVLFINVFFSFRWIFIVRGFVTL